VEGVLVDEGDDPDGAAVRALLRRAGRVVVKPNWGNRGVGVTTHVAMEGVRRACARAQAVDLDEEAVVEPYVVGTNVRVAVIGGEFVAAAEVQRPLLVGGRSPVEQVRALNADARRGSWAAPGLQSMDRIVIEEDLAGHLEVHGFGSPRCCRTGRRSRSRGRRRR
jgi:D-alanine-D-alanine ligase-like ATP-grasp enzyme